MLLVAPKGMRAQFVQMIEAETAHAKAGRPARSASRRSSWGSESILVSSPDSSLTRALLQSKSR